MFKQKIIYLLFLFTLLSNRTYSQLNEAETGAWYMYFWNTTIKESPFGFQGDVQLRNWNILGDLEQLLLRGGFTYSPKNTKAKFTLGYAHITTGEYGEGSQTVQESRFYQEALLPQKIGERFFLVHRFRYEQRFVETLDFRTRWRYNIFINITINSTEIKKGTLYFSFYNELFINGERNVGNDISVELFDRNRTYLALGYSISDNMRVQLGYMQQTTDNWSKGQIQGSIHHKFY